MSPPAALLIDDNEPFARSLVEFLASCGFELDWAASWTEGLDLFRCAAYELVIADYNLPGSEHGLRLLAAMRPMRPSSQLILISGALTSEGERVARTSSIINAFYTKGATEFPAQMLREVTAASGRAVQGRDWVAIAEAHLARGSVDEDELTAIDRAMQSQLHRR
jgi:DNA-binding response OmpR family regulator